MKKGFECDLSVFNTDPIGHVEPLDVATPAIAELTDGVHEFLGEILSAKTWPYRNDNTSRYGYPSLQAHHGGQS